MLPAHPDWLYHRLAIAGPATDLARFRARAQGSGVIPWHTDHARGEEDVFLMLMASPDRLRRGIGAAGARRMAEILREAAQHRHARASETIGRSRACPFDLHALVPVPGDILALGADHPRARDWLWEHWGTPQPLRHVAAEAGELDAFRVRFWSADWTPWRALARLRTEWPALGFTAQPLYAR